MGSYDLGISSELSGVDFEKRKHSLNAVVRYGG